MFRLSATVGKSREEYRARYHRKASIAVKANARKCLIARYINASNNVTLEAAKSVILIFNRNVIVEKKKEQ